MDRESFEKMFVNEIRNGENGHLFLQNYNLLYLERNVS